MLPMWNITSSANNGNLTASYVICILLDSFSCLIALAKWSTTILNNMMHNFGLFYIAFIVLKIYSHQMMCFTKCPSWIYWHHIVFVILLLLWYITLIDLCAMNYLGIPGINLMFGSGWSFYCVVGFDLQLFCGRYLWCVHQGYWFITCYPGLELQ